MKFMSLSAGVRNALLAALLFGASAPAAKIFLRSLSPMELAGALYLGSGLGLALWRSARRFRRDAVKKNLRWGALIGMAYRRHRFGWSRRPGFADDRIGQHTSLQRFVTP